MSTVETVRGPVDVTEFGPTLMHEHVIVLDPEALQNYGHVWGASYWDENIRVTDAIQKLQRLRAGGIRTIVDPTVLGLGRYMPRIQRINAEVDLNIVVATGVYAFLELPSFLAYRSDDAIVELFVREIRESIDDTGVTAAFHDLEGPPKLTLLVSGAMEEMGAGGGWSWCSATSRPCSRPADRWTRRTPSTRAEPTVVEAPAKGRASHRAVRSGRRSDRLWRRHALPDRRSRVPRDKQAMVLVDRCGSRLRRLPQAEDHQLHAAGERAEEELGRDVARRRRMARHDPVTEIGRNAVGALDSRPATPDARNHHRLLLVGCKSQRTMAEWVLLCNYPLREMEASISDFPREACSVASTLEVIGERWTMHILRESFLGVRRFEDYRRNIGVARNILTDRLNMLVAEGILRRELYNEHPPRYEYRLTRKGIDLHGILIELMKWGNRWAPNEDGPALLLRHRDCGHVIEPVLACPDCGEPVHASSLEALPGPATIARAASASGL